MLTFHCEHFLFPLNFAKMRREFAKNLTNANEQIRYIWFTSLNTVGMKLANVKVKEE